MIKKGELYYPDAAVQKRTSLSLESINKNFYCVSSAPPFFVFKAFLGSFSAYIVLGLIGLFLFLLFHNQQNKIKLIDSKVWKLSLFILAVFAFLAYFPLWQYDEFGANYAPDYLVAYVLFFGILLFGNCLGKSLKLFLVGKKKLIILAVLFLLFSGLAFYAVVWHKIQPTVSNNHSGSMATDSNSKIIDPLFGLPFGGCGNFSLW